MFVNGAGVKAPVFNIVGSLTMEQVYLIVGMVHFVPFRAIVPLTANFNLENIRKMKSEKIERWRLFHYDVWGNAKDGWEVNKKFFRNNVFLPIESTNDQILEALKKCGFFHEKVKIDNVDIDQSNEQTIYISDGNDDMPLCELAFDLND